MKTRIISGIAMIIVAVIFLNIGGPLLCAGLCVVACIGFRELLQAMDISPKTSKGFSGIEVVGYICTAALYFCTFAYCEVITDRNIIRLFQKPLLMMGIVMIPFFAFAIYFILVYPKLSASKLMAAYFSYLYVPVLLSYLYTIRANIGGGRYLVWLVVIAASGTDVFAYFIGSFFGKHKLAPVLSPKKSIEGAIGGVAGSILLAVIFGITLNMLGINVESTATNILACKLNNSYWLDFAVICGVASVFSQFGDLLASGIKRNYQIKDYGTLIPGHGGILDRCDSIIFVAPIVYMLSVLLF